MHKRLVIGFAGTTHLAVVSSVAAAARGFDVVCFGSDRLAVEKIRAGQFPVHEPGLDQKAAGLSDRLRFTADVRELAAVDICFVADDVPTDDQARSDLAPVRRLIDAVAPVLHDGAPLVVLCQVPPGFTRQVSKTTRDCFYQVETLVFGEALRRAVNPERFIVGCGDPAEDLPQAYAAYLAAFACPVLKMGYESAELAKIAINLFLVSSISTTNTLAEVCEGLGADWNEIVPALRLDRRIGPAAYLSPGLGIAGGNLERDVATIINVGEALHTDTGVVRAWLANSERRRRWVQGVVLPLLEKRGDAAKIALLGLAYKQETASTKNSAALGLLRDLPDRCTIHAYDPIVPIDPAWHPGLLQATSMIDACKKADILVIMTPWPQFRELSPAAVAERLAGRLVVDPYRMTDRRAMAASGLEVVSLGVSWSDPREAWSQSA